MRCQKCNYPVLPKFDKCPKCGEPLKNKNEDNKPQSTASDFDFDKKPEPASIPPFDAPAQDQDLEQQLYGKQSAKEKQKAADALEQESLALDAQIIRMRKEDEYADERSKINRAREHDEWEEEFLIDSKTFDQSLEHRKKEFQFDFEIQTRKDDKDFADRKRQEDYDFDLDSRKSDKEFENKGREASFEFDLGRKKAEFDFEMQARKDDKEFADHKRQEDYAFDLDSRKSDKEFENKGREASFEFDLGRKKAEFDFDLQNRKADKDFEIKSKQAAFDFDLQNRKADKDFEIKSKQAAFDFDLDQKRTDADTERAIRLDSHAQDMADRAHQRAMEDKRLEQEVLRLKGNIAMENMKAMMEAKRAQRQDELQADIDKLNIRSQMTSEQIASEQLSGLDAEAQKAYMEAMKEKHSSTHENEALKREMEARREMQEQSRNDMKEMMAQMMSMTQQSNQQFADLARTSMSANAEIAKARADAETGAAQRRAEELERDNARYREDAQFAQNRLDQTQRESLKYSTQQTIASQQSESAPIEETPETVRLNTAWLRNHNFRGSFNELAGMLNSMGAEIGQDFDNQGNPVIVVDGLLTGQVMKVLQDCGVEF